MQTPWLHGCLITWRIYLATAFLPLFNFKSECGIIFGFRHNKQADSVSIWSRSVSIPDAIPLATRHPMPRGLGLARLCKRYSTLPAKLRGLQRNPNLVYYLAESLILDSKISVLFRISVTLYKKIRKSQDIKIQRIPESSIKVHFFTLQSPQSEVKSKRRPINFTKTSDNQV